MNQEVTLNRAWGVELAMRWTGKDFLFLIRDDDTGAGLYNVVTSSIVSQDSYAAYLLAIRAFNEEVDR